MNKTITEQMDVSGVKAERLIREMFVTYMIRILKDTEYEGKISVSTQNVETDPNNSIVVAVKGETDAINAFNGKTGYDPGTKTTTFRHDRDALVVLEINMEDNDVVWMLAKYVSMCIIQDMSYLTSLGVAKLYKHPVNEGISLRDSGARKIWMARISLVVKIHNSAVIKAEIC